MAGPILAGALDAPAPRRNARRRAALLGAASLLAALTVVSALLIGGLAALKQRATSMPAAIAPPLPHPCMQAAPTKPLGVVAVGMAHGDIVLLRGSDGKPRWTYHSNRTYATPLLWGQTVVVSAGTNDVFALAVSDGHLLWRASVGMLSTAPLGAAPFTIDCGVALVNEAQGGLVALRVSDGQHLWGYQDYQTPQQMAGKLYPYLDTPLLLAASDGIAYMVSERLQKIGRHQSIIWLVKALRETDGRLLWQAQPQQPDPHYQQPNTQAGRTLALDASPFSAVVLGETFYLIPIATRPYMMAYQTTTGALRWRSEPAIAVGSLQFNTIENRIFGGPAFILVVANNQLHIEMGGLICLVGQQDGTLGVCNGLAALQTGPQYMFLIKNGVTYMPVDEGGFGGPLIYIHAYRLSYYDLLWRWYMIGTGSLASPFLLGIVSASGNIVVGTQEGVYGLRARDGALLWTWSLPGADVTYPIALVSSG